MTKISVKIPASCTNLGPGFGTLGLAINIWNKFEVSLTGKKLDIRVEGEGENEIALSRENLFFFAIEEFARKFRITTPTGIKIKINNSVPIKSGLGSSSSALLGGILAANVLFDKNFEHQKILDFATQIVGRSDNICPALLGGLTIHMVSEKQVIARKIEVSELETLIITPEVKLSSLELREAFTKDYIPMKDFNKNKINSILVIEAFRNKDIGLLREAMVDYVFQPYRLPLIPGAAEAIRAAQNSGAAAALSGAGPSLIAFSDGNEKEVANLMKKEFDRVKVRSRVFFSNISNSGAIINHS